MKILKKILVVLLVFFSMIITSKATTNTIKKGEVIPDVWTKIETPKYNYRSRMYQLTNATTNELVYCIEPGKPLDGEEYTVYNSLSDLDLDLTTDVWNYLQKIAYFGYGYKDHTDIKWYVATQMLIWNYVLQDTGRVYFVDDDFQEVYLYQEEQDAIMAEVNNMNIIPSFAFSYVDTPTHELRANTDLVLEDKNKVLHLFEAEPNNLLATARVEGDTLIYNQETCGGNILVSMSRKFNDVGKTPKIYYNKNGQTLMGRGNISSVTAFILVKGIIPDVKLSKKSNEETSLSLKGAVFGLYSADNDQLIQKYTTNDKGEIVIHNLIGSYYFQELEAPFGFKLSDEKYYFSLNTRSYEDIIVEAQNEVIKKKVVLEKYLAYQDGSMQLESNAEFELLKDGKVIQNLTTDKYGKITMELECGDYILHQVKGTPGFNFAEDIELIIRDDNPENRVIHNDQITGSLVIQKLDGESLELIEEPALFKLKKQDTGEYLVLNGEDTFATKDGGLTLNDIPYGTYLLKEVLAPLGYLASDQEYIVEIKEDKQVITIDVLNTKIKKGSIVIEKKDSENFNPLEGAVFQVYDENNNLIYEGVTDSQGKIVLEDLDLGIYIIKEIAPPQDYIATPKEYVVELVEDKETVVLEVENTKIKKGSLVIVKTDSVSNLPLEGVDFQVFDENNEVIYEGKTDALGQIVIEDLQPGLYTIKEILALEGYILDEEEIIVEIKEDTKSTVEITNRQKIVSPATGTKEAIGAFTLSGIMLFIGSLICNHGSKKS